MTGRKANGTSTMNRSSRAALSQSELNALRRLEGGLANFVSKEQRDLLISMSLVRINEAGRVMLTDEGRRRLDAERMAN
jgi:hypothetical protein